MRCIVRVRALNANDRPLGDLRGVFATKQSGPRMLRWRVVGAEAALGDLPPAVVC